MRKIILILLSILLFSCKKEKEQVSPNNSVDNPVSVGYYGVLQNIKTIGYLNNSIAYEGKDAKAFFTAQEFFSENSIGSLKISGGVVKINTTSLAMQSQDTNIVYIDTSYNTYNIPVVWNVSGSQYVSGFNFLNKDSMPNYNGFYNLPDTFNTANSYTITLTNVLYTDEVELKFDNIHKELNLNQANSFVLSSNELQQLTTPNPALELYFKKTNFSIANSKKYKVQNVLFFAKYGIVIN